MRRSPMVKRRLMADDAGHGDLSVSLDDGPVTISRGSAAAGESHRDRVDHRDLRVGVFPDLRSAARSAPLQPAEHCQFMPEPLVASPIPDARPLRKRDA